ncbi:hypothetical protein C0J52_24386 [Blattella germanica]|nr:hypothetical protein C0J52_24386 [Blattella germanica]
MIVVAQVSFNGILNPNVVSQVNEPRNLNPQYHVTRAEPTRHQYVALSECGINKLFSLKFVTCGLTCMFIVTKIINLILAQVAVSLICNEHRTTPEDHQKVEDKKTTSSSQNRRYLSRQNISLGLV